MRGRVGGEDGSFGQLVEGTAVKIDSCGPGVFGLQVAFLGEATADLATPSALFLLLNRRASYRMRTPVVFGFAPCTL
jgi:hypothetical protein